MTKQELLSLHTKLCDDARSLMSDKNEDYSLRGPFDNILACEVAGICEAERGVLVRLHDKLSRLASTLAKGTRVKNESVRDTVLDVINYAIIFEAVRSDKCSKEGKSPPSSTGNLGVPEKAN